MPLDVLDDRGALGFVHDYLKGGVRGGYVVAANPEKVYALRRDTRLEQFFRHASLIIPDGIGVVLAARILYGRAVRRKTGADLMQEICNAAPSHGYRIFLVGGTEEVNRSTVQILRQRYPGINIAGRANGYGSDMERLVTQINAAQPDVLFVGLGSPKQEQWMCEYLPRINVGICQGVGGTYDTIAGVVRRAPSWMQAIGMEWFYRLLRQPSRARRQLNLMRFIVEVSRAKWSRAPVGQSNGCEAPNGLSQRQSEHDRSLTVTAQSGTFRAARVSKRFSRS
jgi:N-acetylglucosaminyldiphosphoundecaprenol N-acetyl-beta-D-mannosaminyltransferase